MSQARHLFIGPLPRFSEALTLPSLILKGNSDPHHTHQHITERKLLLVCRCTKEENYQDLGSPSLFQPLVAQTVKNPPAMQETWV